MSKSGLGGFNQIMIHCKLILVHLNCFPSVCTSFYSVPPYLFSLIVFRAVQI